MRYIIFLTVIMHYVLPLDIYAKETDGFWWHNCENPGYGWYEVGLHYRQFYLKGGVVTQWDPIGSILQKESIGQFSLTYSTSSYTSDDGLELYQLHRGITYQEGSSLTLTSFQIEKDLKVPILKDSRRILDDREGMKSLSPEELHGLISQAQSSFVVHQCKSLEHIVDSTPEIAELYATATEDPVCVEVLNLCSAPSLLTAQQRKGMLILLDIENVCANGAADKCIENVFSTIDIFDQEGISPAEIARFLRLIGPLVGMQAATATNAQLDSLEISTMSTAAAAITAPYVSKKVIESYDYNNDGLISVKELMHDYESENMDEFVQEMTAIMASDMIKNAFSLFINLAK